MEAFSELAHLVYNDLRKRPIYSTINYTVAFGFLGLLVPVGCAAVGAKLVAQRTRFWPYLSKYL